MGINVLNVTKTPSCYTEFLKFLYSLYTINLEDADLFSLEAQKLLESPIELIEVFIPQLIGFYILHCEFYL
jgi:hypothetical protein